MSHPEDLLADYVDGTLAERERAVVDTHLDGCARCSAEIRQAEAAKTALSALEDVPVPFGVTGPVLAEAGRRFERRRGVAWERFQWAAGLAAAAALIVVVALNVGGGDQPERRLARGRHRRDRRFRGGGSAEATAPGAIHFAGIEPSRTWTTTMRGSRRSRPTPPTRWWRPRRRRRDGPRRRSPAPSRTRRNARPGEGLRPAERHPGSARRLDPPHRGGVRGHARVHRGVLGGPGRRAAPRPHRRLRGREGRLPHPEHGLPEDPARLSRSRGECPGEGSSVHS